MKRCLELAQLGAGLVAPNPMVGAVIVLNKKIIGEGYHERFGEAHAEVNAIKNVQDKSMLHEATIYVSLEPCAHHGKTPPCTDLLIQHRFKRVVIACKDSYHEVAGKGIEKLTKAGIELTFGILEKEALDLNKRFFTFHQEKRPYVLLKWAQSRDGFIDKKRTDSSTQINWISTPETKTLVHQWRAEEQAILVGRKTIEHDNPSLTVRNIVGQHPIRVILDSHLTLNQNFTVFQDCLPTIILNLIETGQKGAVSYHKLMDFNPKTILEELYKLTMQSVMIEGGFKTLSSFIDANLWDEARIIEGNTLFIEGLKAPIIASLPSKTYIFSKDKIFHYFRK